MLATSAAVGVLAAGEPLSRKGGSPESTLLTGSWQKRCAPLTSRPRSSRRKEKGGRATGGLAALSHALRNCITRPLPLLSISRTPRSTGLPKLAIMASLFQKRNNAVAVNYRGAQDNIQINEAGSDWYWAVFSVMAASVIVFSVMAFMTPRKERIFHYFTIAIVATASIAYFTMASDLGSVPIITEFSNYSSLPTRQVFYTRYIDWVITTPLLLIDLLLLAALPWSTIVFTIVMDEIMVLTGLFGAITPSSYKWGYWTIGMVAYFFVAYVLIFEARVSAQRIGSDVHRLYIGIAIWTAVLWTLYPVAWGLSEGGNVTSSDGEAVFYGVLDLLAKPVFGLWILLGHRGIGLERLGLYEGRNDLGTHHHSGSRREKHIHESPTSTNATYPATTATYPAATTATTTSHVHGNPGHGGVAAPINSRAVPGEPVSV